MFAAWDERFAIGVEPIDEDHRLLFGIAKKLSDAVQKGEKRSAIGGVLSELFNASRDHFQREEGLMRQYHFPEYYEHKRMHDALLDELSMMVGEFNTGKSDIDAMTLDFVRTWLAMHTRGADQVFRRMSPESGSEAVIPPPRLARTN